MTARIRSVPASELAKLRAQDDLPQDFWDYPDYDAMHLWDILTRALCAAEVIDTGWARQAILGGSPFGDDHGYGPARTLDPDEVACVAVELDGIGEAQFRRMFARADWTDCYRADARDVEEALVEFTRLRDCYRTAAKAGHAVVLYQ